MKKTNKLLLTLGTAAAITAPVAAVVACGTHAIATNGASDTQAIIGPSNIVKTPAQIAAEKVAAKQIAELKTKIGGLYTQLEEFTKVRDSDYKDDAKMDDLRKQIAVLTHKMDDLGFKAKRNILNIVPVTADLTITDPAKAQLEVIRISNTLAKLSAAISDATTLDEMKKYYPQYIETNKELQKVKDLKSKLENPPVKLNKATEYKVDDAVLKSFTNYFKDFFAGGAQITSYSEFKSDPNNQIAKIGQIFGSGLADRSDPDSFALNSFDTNEGDAGNLGYGVQAFDMEKGLAPHVDIKYEIKNGVDEASILDFFSKDSTKVFGFKISDLFAQAFKTNGHAETMATDRNSGSRDPSLKLFPYVYKDALNPGMIHFSLFAYKNEVPKAVIPQGQKHYTNLRDFNTFRNEYEKNPSIKRGIKKLSDVVGRDLFLKENFYTMDSDFPKIMEKIYYAPKRDEMKYINEHISDADRISLYWTRYQLMDTNGQPKKNSDGSLAIGGFNTMASGRVYGISAEDMYSGKDGSYAVKEKVIGSAIDDVMGLKRSATPGYQTQTLAEAKAAQKNFQVTEKINHSGTFFEQKVPGRELPTLAQSRVDFSTAMMYDLGGEVQFERDSNGKITGIKPVNYDDAKQIPDLIDLRAAMWAMSNQKMGSEYQYYAGLTSWPRGGTTPVNPFLYGLDLKYFSVRDKDNKNDLDLIFEATRGGKALPSYKMVIPEGAMNWEQVSEAVKGNPVYETDNSQLSKEDFEFLMMKVMSKWVESGDSVSKYILPSISKLIKTGLKEVLTIEDIDKYYDLLKDDKSIDLQRLNELVTNPDIDFMDVFLSEAEDSTSRKTLYTKYGENLLNVIAIISKHRILEDTTGIDQDVLDLLSNEFEGL